MVLGVLLLFASQTAASQTKLPQFDEYLFTKNDAYAVMKPMHVVSENVTMMRWSSDGRQLIAIREVGSDEPVKTEAAIWKPGGTVVRSVPLSNKRAVPVDLDFLASGNVLVLTMVQGPKLKMTLSRIPAEGGSATEIATADDGEMRLGFVLNPAKTFGVLSRTDHRTEFVLQPIDSQGITGQPIKLPVEFAGSMLEVNEQNQILLDRFESDGKSGTVVTYVLGKNGPEKQTAPRKPPVNSPVPSPLDIIERGGTFTASRMTARSSGIFLVEKGLSLEAIQANVTAPLKPYAKISADGKNGQLSPDEKWLAFISNGSAFVRRIQRYDKDAFLKDLQEVLKKKAMDDAKLAAIGLLMFSADSNDNLPGPDSDWRKSLEPYLKDSSSLDHFVYNGRGNIAKMEDPSTAEMGYIDTGFGRAIVYADGHVVWKTKG